MSAPLLCLALLGCGAQSAPPTAPASPTAAPLETPSPAPSAAPTALSTAAAAQATFVAARATVTAAAEHGQATAAAQATASQTAVPAASGALSTSAVAEIGRAAAVYLELADRSSGTGIYLGRDRILTAAHVVSGQLPVRVSFDGRALGEARIVSADAALDLAMLSLGGISSAGPKAVAWGSSESLRPGDPIVVVGYPARLLTVTQGIVSALPQRNGVFLLQTDAAVNPGNSGGPILSSRGQLVAISDFVLCATVGLNFGVASRSAQPFAQGPDKPPSGPLSRPRATC